MHALQRHSALARRNLASAAQRFGQGPGSLPGFVHMAMPPNGLRRWRSLMSLMVISLTRDTLNENFIYVE